MIRFATETDSLPQLEVFTTTEWRSVTMGKTKINPTSSFLNCLGGVSYLDSF